MSDADDGLDRTEAPLLEHLVELRKRLIYCVIGVMLAFGASYMVADPIFNWLTQPLKEAYEIAGKPERHLIFTELYEGFITKIKVAFFASLCISFPLIAIQIWKFVAPGLYKNERAAFAPFLVATPVLFAAGASIAYYLLLPNAFAFFISFEDLGAIGTGSSQLSVESMPRVAEYLSLVMLILLAFGVCFQLPVLLVLLARVGILTSDTLKEWRRYAIVGIFTIAAFATPPDVASQFMLAIPLMLLYEISILVIRVMEKKREAS